MEYVILMAVLLAYLSLYSKINKLSNKPCNKTIKTSELKEFLDKNVVISLNNEYMSDASGILKAYDNKWIELETITEQKKKKIKENAFYKINSIQSITVDDKK